VRLARVIAVGWRTEGAMPHRAPKPYSERVISGPAELGEMGLRLLIVANSLVWLTRVIREPHLRRLTDP